MKKHHTNKQNFSANKHILIVEDELELLDILTDTLTSSGFTVLTATTAEKGLKRAFKEQPDLILLDVLLPKMDGITMLKKLRSNARGWNIPVIVLSNFNGDKLSEAMKFNIYDYLLKANLKLSDLVSEIKQVLLTDTH